MPKPLVGWLYELQEGGNRRRSRRGNTDSSDNITLKRDSDQLEIKPGDAILARDRHSQSTEVALVNEIRLGLGVKIIDISVSWFLKASEVEKSPNSNELFLTAAQGEIDEQDIIERVEVLSRNDYEKLTDKSNAYVSYRGYDSVNESTTSSEFDYYKLHETLRLDRQTFIKMVKDLTAEPREKTPASETPKKRRSPVKLKEESKSKIDLGPESVVENLEGQQPRVNGHEKKDEEADNDHIQSDNEDKFEEPEASDKDDDFKIEGQLEESTDAEAEDSDSEESFNEDASPSRSGRKRNKKQITKSPTKSPRKLPQKDKKLKMMADVLSPLNKSFKIKPIIAGPTLSSLSPKKKGVVDLGQVSNTSKAFKELKAKLHTSAKLHSLPGREEESFQLLDKISTAIETGTGSCVYVSGTPGLGKTATIRVVISQLQELVEYGDFKDFDFLEINGLKLLSPNVAYETLWTKVSGYKVSASNAAILLEQHFSTPDPQRKPLVVLMDELDQIVTKNQNVMYNFFNWPTYEHSKLVVIAVANTMDLPERVLSNKISSRLGLNRIQFIGYSFAQLGDIIKHRLEMITKSNRRKVVLEPDAVGFALRKVASVSGDARRALTICRRAVEIAEKEYLDNTDINETEKDEEEQTFHVKITHISKAIFELVNSPTAQFLLSLLFASKLLLQAVLLRKRRSGLAENSLGDVIDEMKNSLTMMSTKQGSQALRGLDLKTTLMDLLYGSGLFDAKGKVNIRVLKFKQIVNELVENGILLQQNVAGERYRMIQLNVGEEEVSEILTRDEILGK